MSINEELTDSKHHDLCFLSEGCEGECICERLWQAENMARFATMHLTDVDSYNEGKREALADAVQRVEALADEMRNWSSAETNAATEAAPDLTFDQWLWTQRGVLRSIAAIKGGQE